MWLLLAVFGLALLIGYRWLNSYYDYWKQKGVPNPTPNILVGNIAEAILMKKSLGQIFEDVYK